MKTTMRLLKHILIPALICFFQLAKAQIVYTDVNPDSTSTATYNLDLNNDGVTDFKLTHSSGSEICPGGCGVTVTTNKVKISPTSGNAVEVDSSEYPIVFSSSELIDSSLNFSTSGNRILASLFPFTCGFYGGCVMHGNGNWFGAIDKYLGLQIKVGSNYYYGWARLDLASGGTDFTIKDYAYDSIANQSIPAGDSVNIPLGISLQEGGTNFSISPNPFSSSTTISFSLSQSEIITLKIFDVEGRLIRTLTNESMSAGMHSLLWNASDENGNAENEGIYLLQISSPQNSKAFQLSLMK